MRTNEPDSTKKTSTSSARGTRRAAPAAKPTTRAKRAPRGPSAGRPDDDQIRRRAYELYLERGHYGDPMEDWLRAERELIDPAS